MNIKSNAIGLLMAVSMLHDMPCLGFRYPSAIYALLVIVLFLILCLSVRINNLIKILPIFALPGLNIIPLIVDGSNIVQILQYISGLLQMMSYPLAAIYIIENRNYKLGRNLFILYIVINLITCITTYYGNIMFPGASRALATGMSDSPFLIRDYLMANIGGFSFVYSMVMFVPILIYTWKNHRVISHGMMFGILSIGYIGIIFFTLVTAEYTTAILLFILCISLFFIGNTLNVKKLILLGCISFFLFLVLKGTISDVLLNISENVESANISERLKDLSFSLNNNNIDSSNYDSDLIIRQNHYNKSFESFIANPLGSWTQKAVGGHSFILDSLGKFGILGIFCILLLYVKLYKLYVLPLKGNNCYGYVLFTFFVFIITTFVNPMLLLDSIMFILPLYTISVIALQKR